VSKIEIYLLLFTDSFVSSLAINTSKEIMVYTIKAFNSANREITIIVVTVASLVANFANYFFGKVLYNIFDRTGIEQQRLTRNNRLLKLAKYNRIFLLLSIIPFFGKFVPVIAGFSKFPMISTILICSGLKFGYYIYLMIM
jgi:membrane protein YqaA with SNARE-associated domain